jgi:hypothetical protein
METEMAKTFRVTDAHGRLRRALPDGRRVLVAIPGDEISLSLAEELGLIEPEKPITEKLKEDIQTSTPGGGRASYPTKTTKATPVKKGK